ncbi:MAG: hypothetical protein Kow0042_01510 [Calditrichia bacterium]
MEEKTEGNPFAITPYKPIYMIPVVFSTNPNNEEYRRFSSNASLNNVEVQFQLSFKLLLWRRIFGHKADLYLAYTQLSLWQAYNLELSSPFRETNYEPEFILRSALNTKILGAKLRFVSLALNHQSNGRNAPLSRSWNRIISSMAMEKGHFYWNLRVWVRVLNDGNPDMLEYLGNGDLLLVFVPHKRSKQAISVFFRPNMRSNFRGALQVEWTFPLGINHLKAYVQFFTGYGQSMIDYNHKQTRIGAGIMLTNWL